VPPRQLVVASSLSCRPLQVRHVGPGGLGVGRHSVIFSCRLLSYRQPNSQTLAEPKKNVKSMREVYFGSGVEPVHRKEVKWDLSR
jgi:hypothetical protein